MKKQANLQSTNASTLQQTAQVSNSELQKAERESMSEQAKTNNKLPMTDQEQEPNEVLKETKECFAKQLEISSQFSYDFDKYDDSKDDLDEPKQ